MIRLEKVSFSYGGPRVLQDLSLRVEEGDFVGVVGPNSAGKSTLLRLLAGTRRPLEGQVVLRDRPLQQWTLGERAQTMTMVLSEHFFAFPFTVQQIVLMGRIPFVPRGRAESRQDIAVAEEAMRQTDVWSLRDRAVHELSSGERQRVLLARALAQEPRLLLLDEPASHLDLAHQSDFFGRLRKLHTERRLTVVCALHDLSLAARFADRLILLKGGRVIAEGPPREVLEASRIREVFGLEAELQWLPSGPPGLFIFDTV